jgi:predicted nuclease of predicted toxin-antitoxin system
MKQEWHEFQDEGVQMPPGPRKKLTLLADACVPKLLVDELRAFGLTIRTAAEMGIAGHPDENVCTLAARLGWVILTMDRDFWDDRKHPLQKCPGIEVLPA